MDFVNDATILPDHLNRQTVVMKDDSESRFSGNPVMDALRANRAADGAANALKAAGVPVPARVQEGYSAFEVIKRTPVAPNAPSLFADKKQVDAYHAEYRDYLVRRDAHASRVEAGRAELKKLVSQTANEVLDAIRDRFEAAAADFVESHRALKGVESLQDAATDPTGDGTRLWHQRNAATKELNTLVKAVNGYLTANRGGQSLKTMQLVALVSAPTHGVRDLYATIRDNKSPHARWAALTDAGWELRLAETMRDYRWRWDVIEDRLEDVVADDPSISVEVTAVADTRAKRVPKEVVKR